MEFWLLMVIGVISACSVEAAASAVCKPTVAAIEGPYYKAGAPVRDLGRLCNATDIAHNGTNLVIKGRVTSEDCQTGVQALLDVWQADSDGVYALNSGNYACRGKYQTDPAGYFTIETVVPGWYAMGGAYRPAHVHWKISPLNEPANVLTTQMYFMHDPFLADKDPCPGICHSGDPTVTVPKHKVIKKEDTVFVIWGIVLRKSTGGKN